jgi:hypothetical protein
MGMGTSQRTALFWLCSQSRQAGILLPKFARVNLYVLYVCLKEDSCVKMTSMRKELTISPDMKLKKGNIFLSVGHQKELKKISRQTDVPVSALIRRAIAEFLEREKKKKP